MEYQRILPRDLFNEAKLLKCIGLVCLRILDNQTPCPMSNSEMDGAFEIALLDEGSLTITNLHINIQGKPFLFKTSYNSKANYPLFLEYDCCDYRVFDEQGNWDADFIEFCETVSPEVSPNGSLIIEVNNLANFEFWLDIFKPMTKKWRREQLKYLKGSKGVNLLETQDKIKALKFLLK